MNSTTTAVVAVIRPNGSTSWVDQAGTIHHEQAESHNEARSLIVTRIADMAEQAEAAIPARIEDGSQTWYVSVDPDGMTTPLDPAGFPDMPTPPAPPADIDFEADVDADTRADEYDGSTSAPDFHAAGTQVDAPADLSDDASGQVDPWAVDDPIVLLELAADPDETVRRAAEEVISADWEHPDLLANATLTADQLDRLAGSSVDLVAEGVAANPATSPHTLDDLARHPSPQVRAAVARHDGLWPATVATLSQDQEPLVRAALGSNPAARFVEPATTKRPGWKRIALGLAIVAVIGAAILFGLRLVGDDPATPTAPAPSSTTWNNLIVLPVSPVDGPTAGDGDTVSGFTRTDLGAALAAANLSVRIDPYAGPASFVPTITDQTFGGDAEKLVAQTRTAYKDAAAASSVTDNGPLPGSAGRIEGWRTDPAVTADTQQTTVHLKVVDPSGEALDFAIAMIWDQGDWKLLDPTRKDTFVQGPAAGDYQNF